MSTLQQPRGNLRLVWSAPSSASAASGAPTLDRKQPPVYLARMTGKPTREDLLRNQEWGKLTAQIAAFAFRRTHKRSWMLAEDLAQDAIALAWAKKDKDGWDPDKEPLRKYLARKVIGLASNEWKRKRNSFEVLMDRRDDEDDESYEDPLEQVPSPDDGPDELLDRRRVAAKFQEKLTHRLREKPASLEVIELMKEGVITPRDQVAATGRTIDVIRDARRAIFYHAEVIAKELSLDLDANDGLEDNEVTP